jgi:anti-sigma B factor antagonist
MEIAIEQCDDVAIAEPHGRIDNIGVRSFRNLMENLVQSGKTRILIDLQYVTYVNSAAIREMLLTSRNLVQRQGGLALCSLSPEVQRLFDMVGLGAVLTMCKTRDEGVAVLH